MAYSGRGGIRLEGILRKRFCNFHYPALKNHIYNANDHKLCPDISDSIVVEEFIVQCHNDGIFHPRSRVSRRIKEWRDRRKMGLKPEQKLDIALRYALRLAEGECRRINLRPLGLDSFDSIDTETAYEEYLGLYE
ncbi:MAG TPA: hypothetical protein HA362_04275 [Nanoarchaeota archaeon]|nr:hypothetical protein [Nanoarchaeota archaeon]